jgi:hypothetical protein
VKFLNLFKPKWQQGSRQERQDVINQLTDTQVLQIIIENDDEAEIQDTAVLQMLESTQDANLCMRAIDGLPSMDRRKNLVRRISNQSALQMVAMNHADEVIRTCALLRLNDKVQRYKAIVGIKNDFYLKKIIAEEPCGYLKAAALSRITNQKYLSEIIMQILRNELVCPLPPIVLQRFLELIDDESIFGMFVTFYYNRPKYARAAIDRINDSTVLLNIIQNRLVNDDTRRIAVGKIPGHIPLWENQDASFDKLDFSLKMPEFSSQKVFEPALN